MNTDRHYGIRELRKRLREAISTLHTDGPVVVTHRGKPVAVLVPPSHPKVNDASHD